MKKEMMEITYYHGNLYAKVKNKTQMKEVLEIANKEKSDILDRLIIIKINNGKLDLLGYESLEKEDINKILFDMLDSLKYKVYFNINYRANNNETIPF